ncbi:MAG: O-antigen ligase family protein [Bacteroidales bacterium]|nr:O-antigen ligase family protein [Bacteroidales bacterium]
MNISQVFLNNKPYIATIFMALVTTSMIGFVPAISAVMKVALYSSAFLFLAFKGGKVDKKYIAFIVFLVFNLIICSPESFYGVWERLGIFTALFLVVSSFFVGNYARRFRWQALKTLLGIVVVLSTLSFFGFFLGINMMVRFDEVLTEYQSNAGWFSGFYTHSMLLGPMSALAACCIIYLALKKKSYIIALCAIPSIGSVMFAASRTAFIAMIIAFLFMVYRYSESKATFSKILIASSLVLVISFPLWNTGLDRMASKQQAFETQGRFGSRTDKWTHRLEEFETSPIWGIGFSTVSRQSGDVDTSSGTIEPGSSWFAILSMTGIVGIAFVFIFFRGAFYAIKKSINQRAVLLMAMLIFISIHMFGEGYIFAGGNPVAVIAWLIVGCGNDLKYET